MKKYILLIVLSVLSVVGLAGFFALDNYTASAQFCGSTCHLMEPVYETWKKDKHKEKKVECVDCHYVHGERNTFEARFKALTELFIFLSKNPKEVHTRAKVRDESCVTSDCHPLDKLYAKKVDYKKHYDTEFKGILHQFDHKSHIEKTTKEVEKIRCTSCHMHTNKNKHFEVPKDLCFLCHFTRSRETVKDKENEGRNKCSLCHEISKKALVETEKPAEGEKPQKAITHQTIEEGKISCNSCHFGVTRVKIDVKKEFCAECHIDRVDEYTKKMEGKDGGKIMHETHVIKQTARCYHCHPTIEHKSAPLLEAVTTKCATCHPEPHLYQRQLLAGEGGKGMAKAYPIKHHNVKTICVGCHTKEAHDAKGRKIKAADEKNCVGCHNKEAGETMKKWIKDMAELLKEAKAVEKEAVEVLEEARGRVSEKELKKAIELIKKGRENLRLVDAGGGAHNKKFATLVLDTAIADFDAAIAELKPRK